MVQELKQIQVRLDHILVAQENIRLACFSGIDHEISSAYLASDHYLVYASFVLSCSDTSPTYLQQNSSIIVV